MAKKTIKDQTTDIIYHANDIPPGLNWGKEVAIDTETTGLNLNRDRLCLVQLRAKDGPVHLVGIEPDGNPENLIELLEDNGVMKIFHYARFDVAMLCQEFMASVYPIWCTKIASKIARTYTDKHGLKDLVKELLEISLDKEQQSSDWAKRPLSPAQKSYAAQDVLYLHDLKKALTKILKREERLGLAEAAMDFLPLRVMLDLEGWQDTDIFAHS